MTIATASKRRACIGASSAFVLLGLCLTSLHAAPRATGRDGKQEGKSAPTTASAPKPLVLFSGRADQLAKNWVKRGTDQPADWKIENGALITQNGDIATKEKFTDFMLHVEFRVPYMPEAHGQERGNSGIGLQSRYELQILDSYGIAEPGSGDCGAVYSQHAPLTNACKPPMQWQTYDVMFRAPRVDSDGKVTEKARITVFLNGIPVQNNQEIDGPTGIQYGDKVEPGEPAPLVLQYHHNTVAFRNVRITPLALQGAQHY